MKIVSIVGARPQFIKAATLSRVLRKNHTEVLVHTGQHYDYSMSNVFFEELEIPPPSVNLNVGSGSHAVQTGTMLIRIENTLLCEEPDLVLVFGDTNSTIASALAASKLHIPVAHVEAGLRSFNRNMPEEINRVVTDHLSDLLFCPSQTALDNLRAEGILNGAHLVGDVMADALTFAAARAEAKSTILDVLKLHTGSHLLVTLHRAENTDNEERLRQIFAALAQLDEKIVFPIHPRTKKSIGLLNYSFGPNILIIDPVSYFDMVCLEKHARMILTDSGGVQKEAYWLSVPCITLRDESEWVETLETGWNVLTGADKRRIIHEVRHFKVPEAHPALYGDGQAALRCAALLSQKYSNATDTFHKTPARS